MARGSGRIFVAKQTIHLNDGGVPVVVNKGERVREGHPYIVGRESFFEEASAGALYEVESATAAPGEKRGASAAASVPAPVPVVEPVVKPAEKR